MLCALRKSLAAMGLLVCVAGSAAERLTYADLVKRLTDLEQLSVLPVPGERCALCSSYDRASKYDEKTGKYVAWDANGDGGGIIRKEGDVAVIAEMEGPGCIWRTWSATAEKGHVKIFLDGAAEPAVDLPFMDYFSRKCEPFTYPALVYKTAANGLDSYVPIPYQKSCKIVAEKGWGNYYQFTYSTFPKDTVVPTFTRNLSAEDQAALKAADEALSKGLGSDPAGARAGQETVTASVTVEPGKAATLAKIAGARAVTNLTVKVDAAGVADVETALRAATLSIRWDNEEQPSVWTPLGDFFGTAPGINPYRSLPLGMVENSFYSYWFMPFAKEALIEVQNDGATPLKLEATIQHAPLARPIETLGRFHAKWHRDAFLPAEPERAIDWTLLKATGRGRFCGVMLHVWNPCGDWWGEGDEKFFVDGEKFPSTIGTGSEDYFGYAWSSGRKFFQALHNQTRNHGDNVGHLSVNRWHIADNVPFQTGFEGAIEKYFSNKRPTQYAAVVYWYQAPGGTDPYAPLPLAERVGYCTTPYSVEGAIEGEFMKVLQKAGDLRRQDMGEFKGKWGYSQQLFWTKTKVGDKLVLAVPVKTAGKYELSVQLTKAGDYGTVQTYWDDEKLGEPVDCYNEEVVPTGEMALGTRELTAGQHKFTLEITGKNEKSRGLLCGLDYVRLVPAK
jgi:hypothetical protein